VPNAVDVARCVRERLAAESIEVVPLARAAAPAAPTPRQRS